MTATTTVRGSIAMPVEAKIESPYSIDQNLWGRSAEAGLLEDPWDEPPAEAFAWTVDPVKAPNEPEYVEIEFGHGVPVALNGEKLDGVPLIDRLFPKVRLSKFSNSLIRDNRDDLLDPSRGAFLALNSDVAGRAVGSEVGFVKTFAQAFEYFRLPVRRRIMSSREASASS